MIEHFDGYFIDFGEAVAFGTSTTTALVDMPTVDEMGVLGRDVVVTAPESEVSGVAAGDAVTIRSVAYTVRAVLSDGAGMATITVTKP